MPLISRGRAGAEYAMGAGGGAAGRREDGAGAERRPEDKRF